MTAAALWDRLSAEGSVEGEMPDPGTPASPWFVRLMLGIAGWIGACFLMLFVGAAFAFVMKSADSAIGIGLGCCAAAFILFRRFAGNDFVDQFALVVSLVGQGLLIIGLSEYLKLGDASLFLAIAAMQAILALVIPNFLHRILASGGAAVALALAINQLRLHGLAAPLLCAGITAIWLDPRRWATQGAVWRPVGYGLVLALLLVETIRLFGAEWLFAMTERESGWIAAHGPLIGRELTAALLVLVAIVVTRREGLAPTGRAGLLAIGAAMTLGLLSLGAPGLASALLILLLGFAAANRILIGVGVLSLIGFVSHFYYSLHSTLLEKSGLLFVTGLCLLALHVLLRRLPPAETPEILADA